MESKIPKSQVKSGGRPNVSWVNTNLRWKAIGAMLVLVFLVCQLTVEKEVCGTLVGTGGSNGGLTFPHVTGGQPRKPKLADGCHHVYLDVGANVGLHGRFLYEPHKFPKAKKAHEVFDGQFGRQRDNRDFCVFGFEPNPAHKNWHDKVEASYNKLGWRYKIINVGVSDMDDTLFFNNMGDEKMDEWGFNAVNRRAEVSRGKIVGKKIPVPVIRLSTWIEEHIHGRLLPEVVYGNYSGISVRLPPADLSPKKREHWAPSKVINEMHGPPKVVMKMDIEGMEFRTMPDLLYTGVFCNYLDYVFGEAHYRRKAMFPMDIGPGNITLSAEDAAMHWRGMINSLSLAQNCKAVYVDLDDESYTSKRVPLPD